MRTDTIDLDVFIVKSKYKLDRTKGGVARVELASDMDAWGPVSARIWVDRDGWFNRANGPSVENDNGVKIWFVHGERTKG